MKQYRTVNNLMGWLTFIIAATVYCLTIEPTASFWDCPEFITTGYKLEVGHPPGAPFFMLMANLFTQFASDVTTVAKMVNYMSALMSGACILFLFWSITHLVRKLIITDENNITKGQLVTIMGSGLVGALVYTFSDTFWFSAVEGEVYAFSSLFTAVVFWLILKWEDVADQPHSDRWIILIAYLTGLSIGVHLLNLLCLPAIVLVYYYKKTPNATAKGSLLALFGSMVLVAAVLYGIVPGIVKVGGWFELLFVNGLGMPFNTGVVVYIILLAAALIWGVYESYTQKSKARMAVSFILTIALLGIPFYGHGASSILIGILVIGVLAIYLAPQMQEKMKEKWRISARTLNTTLLCTMMIVIGYSSYALIVIRSTANTPMDQNSPEDIFTLGEYLGREQYGTRPLFYGPAFSSKVALDVKDGYCIPRQSETGSKYVRKEKTSPDEKDSYIELPGRIEYEYAQNMLFPRMYSSSHAYREEFRTGKPVEIYEKNGVIPISMLHTLVAHLFADVKNTVRKIKDYSDKCEFSSEIRWAKTPGLDENGEYKVFVHKLQIGEIILMGFGGELYSALGKEIQEKIGKKNLILINHDASLLYNSGYIYSDEVFELAEKYESNIVGMNHTWMKPGYILEALVKNMQEMF